MSVRLKPEIHPYSGHSPFEILGVKPTASAREIQEAYTEMLEETDYGDYDDQTRIAKRDEVNRAYNAIRDVRSRAGIEVFLFDTDVGRNKSLQIAEKHKTLRFEFRRLLTGSDEVFPAEPSVPDARTQFREIAFDASTQLRLGEEHFATDHKSEALESITFEQ